METKKLKFTQVQKLSENYYENSKRKALRITWILSYLYTFQNDLQALSWAFVLGGIGLKEALVDCSWSLKKNQSEPIEPGLSFAKVGPKVWAKVRGLTLGPTFHSSKPNSSGMDVGANVRVKVRGLTLPLTFHSSKLDFLVWTLVPTLGV